jgi:acyl carrier protein
MHDDLRALAQLIIDGLHLEDLTPEGIDPAAPLFGAGLRLDSIDALELAVLVERTYGVAIADGESGKQAFASLASLHAFINERRPA